MNEIIEKMNDLSLNARISYGIMCLENYVLSKYKSIDFTVLLKDLWKINSVKLIDTEWYYPMMARSVSSLNVIPRMVMSGVMTLLSFTTHLTAIKSSMASGFLVTK